MIFIVLYFFCIFFCTVLFFVLHNDFAAHCIFLCTAYCLCSLLYCFVYCKLSLQLTVLFCVLHTVFAMQLTVSFCVLHTAFAAYFIGFVYCSIYEYYIHCICLLYCFCVLSCFVYSSVYKYFMHCSCLLCCFLYFAVLCTEISLVTVLFFVRFSVYQYCKVHCFGILYTVFSLTYLY